MANILKISEAASLGIHSVILLACYKDKLLSTRDIAQTLSASEAHLSKILQRLIKHGFVQSIRGPQGGFRLLKSPQDITLMDIFEAIEGPFQATSCLFQHPLGKCEACIFEELINSCNRITLDYFSNTKISDLTNNLLPWRQHNVKKDRQD